jgi:hypothetical protein
MKVIALFGRGNIGKTHCLGHLINLIYQDTTGCNYFVEGKDMRVTLDYLGKRVTICTWGDNKEEERSNLEKIRKDKPDIAIVATRTRGETVKLVDDFCTNEAYCTPKWVEKYVASFDDISGQEYLNYLQAEQILDYVRGLIKGQLYYVDSISSISEDEKKFHVTLLGAEMSDGGYPRTLSLELTANEMFVQNLERSIQEDDFVFYRLDSDNRFLNGNEEQIVTTLRNESQNIRQELREREIQSQYAFALLGKPDLVKSYHVNVGHGNCSLILLMYGTDYELWMVDCSTYDYLIRCDYSHDLCCCLSDIAATLNIELKNLHISRFMLTHTHFDHYNGLSYLIKNGYVDGNTLMYVNLYFDCASPIWTSILKELIKIRCKFVEPMSKNGSVGAIHIYHPECRILKAESPVNKGERTVSKVNDSSVVYGIELDGHIMVFPGDLEQHGFEKMSQASLCSANLFESKYYVVSHHGSINGHPAIPCNYPQRHTSILACASHNLSKAILMGRGGAYSGIYNSKVISYWESSVVDFVYSEKAHHYVELDWKSDKVTCC